jgi:hypothetical protein
MEICQNNYIYHFKKINGETNKNFINRCWFLAEQEPNTNSLDKITQNSEIWSNIKFLKCKYDSNTHTYINKLTDKEIYKTNHV